jgi:hypothetical protein
MDVVNQRMASNMTNPDLTSSAATTTATEQVRRWSHRWVALAGCQTPADVMAACCIPDSFSDAALSALLRIVNGRYEGSPLAAEILLQTLLPPAMRQHARPVLHESADPGDAAGMLIAGIVEAIATYPLGRRLGVKEHLLDQAGMAFREKARTTTAAERRAGATCRTTPPPCPGQVTRSPRTLSSRPPRPWRPPSDVRRSAWPRLGWSPGSTPSPSDQLPAWSGHVPRRVVCVTLSRNTFTYRYRAVRIGVRVGRFDWRHERR